MKTVLIPTDFSPSSLQLVEFALLQFKDTPLDIILVHGFRQSDRYWDLQTYSPAKQIRSMCSKEFYRAKELLLLEHKEQIKSVRVELYTGSNDYMFKKFVADQCITAALVTSQRMLNFSHRRSFDPTPLAKKYIKSVHEVTLSEKTPRPVLAHSSFLNIF